LWNKFGFCVTNNLVNPGCFCKALITSVLLQYYINLIPEIKWQLNLNITKEESQDREGTSEILYGSRITDGETDMEALAEMIAYQSNVNRHGLLCRIKVVRAQHHQ
jgi:hypothetical protein